MNQLMHQWRNYSLSHSAMQRDSSNPDSELAALKYFSVRNSGLFNNCSLSEEHSKDLLGLP